MSHLENILFVASNYLQQHQNKASLFFRNNHQVKRIRELLYLNVNL